MKKDQTGVKAPVAAATKNTPNKAPAPIMP